MGKYLANLFGEKEKKQKRKNIAVIKLFVNHVWQVGDDVNGDQPLQHRVTLQNVDSTETINITSPDGQSYGQNWSFLRSSGAWSSKHHRVGNTTTNWSNNSSVGLLVLVLEDLQSITPSTLIEPLAFSFSHLAQSKSLSFRLKPKITDDYRKYWNMYHHFLGYGLLAIIVINIFKGISMLKGGVGWKWAYIGIIAFLGAIILTFEIVTWLRFMLKLPAISIPPKENKTNNNPTQNKH
ncbi:cytochrome b561 and DOMON domain-containing protein At5g35735-like [Arachis ipaensis]|uniref:cytochrome b561 and DOMON domain-containing protein At5g35735-like n=1 Tax=Arachis ipaensis TaxID=130454 RepID=UPI000A2B1BEA|nr:cytochrome b561 and DOMON domain-containing protein At5g35735-like [Arachis ipaensis]